MIFKKLPKSRRSSALLEELAGLLAVVSLLYRKTWQVCLLLCHCFIGRLGRSACCCGTALLEDLAGLLAVVSLLFSCSSSEVLEMLCSTGTSTGICMIFFRHWTPVVYSRFRVRHWSDTVETLLAYLEWVITAFTNFYSCVTLHGAYNTQLNMWCVNLLDMIVWPD